jgi:parallel beta-helix repeat protein
MRETSARQSSGRIASRRTIGGAALAVGLFASLGIAAGASAAPTKVNFKTMKGVCGQLVEAPNTTLVLQNDVGPCASDGLRIKGNDVTVDLNGHSIKGTPLIPDGPDADTVADGGFGEGVGIRMVGNRRVTVTNSKYPGTPSVISDFDAGLVIQGGSTQPATGNVVTNIQFFNNVGSQPEQSNGGCGVTDPGAICDLSDFNDGLALVAATGNTIGPNNLFKANGSGGVRLDDSAAFNTITGNRAEANKGNGIRIITNASNNLITGNTSTLNTGSGVSTSFESPDNTIRGNTLVSNNGSGVSTSYASERTIIDANTINFNKGGGITLGSGQNTLTSNTLMNNGRGASGLGRGNGIQVGSGTDNFPRVGMLVMGNTVTGSGGNGIRINCISDQDPTDFNIYGCTPWDTHDQILNNTVTGNAVNGPNGTLVKAGVQDTGFFDLLDSANTDATLTPFNPASSPAIDVPTVPYSGGPMVNCATNTWSGNTFGTAYPPSCVN